MGESALLLTIDETDIPDAKSYCYRHPGDRCNTVGHGRDAIRSP